jgi:hypothetical protein
MHQGLASATPKPGHGPHATEKSGVWNGKTKVCDHFLRGVQRGADTVLGKESQRPCQSDRLNEYSLGTKVILWASLWISIGGVGNANLIATTNTEAKPMKNSITTCVESKRAVKASAHKSMHGPMPRHSGVKTLCVLGKIDTKKSVRCGAALLRARLGSSPNREIASGNLAGSSSRVNAGGSNPPTRTHLISFKN